MATLSGGLSTRVMPLLGYCEGLDAPDFSTRKSDRRALHRLLERPDAVQAAWRAHNLFVIWWNHGIIRILQGAKRCIDQLMSDLPSLRWHTGFEKHSAFSSAFGAFCKNSVFETHSSSENAFAQLNSVLCEGTQEGRANRLFLGAHVLNQLPPTIQDVLGRLDADDMQREYEREKSLVQSFLEPLETLLAYARLIILLGHAEYTQSYLAAARSLWRTFEVQDSALSNAYLELGVARKLQPRDMTLAFENTLLRRKPMDIFAEKQRSGLALGPLSSIVANTPLIVNRGINPPNIDSLERYLRLITSTKAKGQPINSPLDIAISQGHSPKPS